MTQEAKDPSGEITVTFDFSNFSSSAVSSPTVTGTIYQGTDSTPLVMGSASVSGTVVSQPITGGTAGAIYKLRCSATQDSLTRVKGKWLAVRSVP